MIYNSHNSRDDEKDMPVSDYDDGYAAYLEGKPVAARPCNMSDFERIDEWEDGWYTAEEDCRRSKKLAEYRIMLKSCI